MTLFTIGYGGRTKDELLKSHFLRRRRSMAARRGADG
jgi:hypothetical protein